MWKRWIRWFKRVEKRNYTYMVRCQDGSLYTGWTNDIEHRIEAYNSGRGAKYTKARRPVKLVYYETFLTKQEAMKREYEIKRMTKREKESLLGTGEKPIGDGVFLKKPPSPIG